MNIGLTEVPESLLYGSEKTFIFYLVIAITVNDLATLGTSVSVTIALIKFFRNTLVSALNG